MSKISFKYCPICSEELDTGKVKFPAPHSILDCIEAEGKYYSDKEGYSKNPLKRIFWTHDKLFTVETLGGENLAGYCENCNKIFAEFDVTEEY